MSEATIYQSLRSGGLTPTAACAMMGNMYCESGLISNNVEDRCTLGDFDYTYAVDNGTISRYQFKVDAYGYGLCQWTYPTRKEELYNLARERGVSIGDEHMQCELCLRELQRDFANLYAYLCVTSDLPEATKRICSEFERPAVNNFADRINVATRFYNQLADSEEVVTPPQAEATQPPTEPCNVTVRTLKKGDLGRDVFLLQCGLTDMGYGCGIPDGDFGSKTDGAVRELQTMKNYEASGIVDQAVWMEILRER